jgi:hypothetical protein
LKALGVGVRTGFRATGSVCTLIFQGACMADFEAYERTVEAGLVLGIAQALREEFGDSIDAQPGGKGSEAGVVNRAFQASARRILGAIIPTGEDLDDVVSWVLRRSALLRLAEVGVDGGRAAGLLESEPGLGDAWPGYLILAPVSIIEELIGEEPALARSPE